MTVDDRGNVFATGPGGVLVISSEAGHLGTVSLGGTMATDVVIGGDGYLYIAATGYVMRVRVLTKAAPPPSYMPNA